MSSYYIDNEQGLKGKWGLSLRLKGLEPLLDVAKDKTILDVGAAEGLVALEFAKRGATYITGIEYENERVIKANEIFSEEKLPGLFLQGDLNNWANIVNTYAIVSDFSPYDIVLFLGIFHHLRGNARLSTLNSALDVCNEYFAVRTPEKFMPYLLEAVYLKGFKKLVSERGVEGTDLGNLVIFERK